MCHRTQKEKHHKFAMGRIINSFIISTPVTEPFLDVPNVLTILQQSVNQNVTPPSYSNNATKITPIDASSCVPES